MSKSDKWFFGLMGAYGIAGAFDLWFKWFDVAYLQVAWVLAMIIVLFCFRAFPWQKRK